jgi:hypothetical protein
MDAHIVLVLVAKTKIQIVVCSFGSVQLHIGSNYKGKIFQSQGISVKFYVCKRFHIHLLHSIFGEALILGTQGVYFVGRRSSSSFLRAWSTPRVLYLRVCLYFNEVFLVTSKTCFFLFRLRRYAVVPTRDFGPGQRSACLNVRLRVGR